jgi:hypothetical protein
MNLHRKWSPTINKNCGDARRDEHRNNRSFAPANASTRLFSRRGARRHLEFAVNAFAEVNEQLAK